MNSKKDISYDSLSLDEVVRLRGFFSKCWGELIEKVMDVITGYHEDLANQRIGPRKRRVGVFGPYPGVNKEIIIRLARKISSMGFAAITGEGFYLNDNPSSLHDLEEISPPNIKALFEHPDIPQYHYYRILPRLVSKAFFLMNDERGQTIELIGCFDAGIPVLGFIIHDNITNGDRDCVYLQKKGDISTCTVPDHLSCLGNARQRPWCPFYDSVNISWLTKQLFLRRKEHHLVAVRRIQDLKPIVNIFVSQVIERELLLDAIKEE